MTHVTICSTVACQRSFQFIQKIVEGVVNDNYFESGTAFSHTSHHRKSEKKLFFEISYYYIALKLMFCVIWCSSYTVIGKQKNEASTYVTLLHMSAFAYRLLGIMFAFCGWVGG